MGANQRFKLYTAFGERKSLRAWSRDPRCPFSQTALYHRVVRLGLSIPAAFDARARLPGRHRLLTVDGETKGFLEWAADPRCRVKVRTLRGRLYAGWSDAAAVLTPANGVSPSGSGKGSKGRVGRRPPVVVVAWGEAKTVVEWARDRRARVREETIRYRLSRGYPPEKAIGMPTVPPH